MSFPRFLHFFFGKLTALQPTTASSDRAVTVAAVGSVHAFRSTAYVSPVETIRATRPQNEKDHRSDRWSQKPQRLFVGNCLAVPCRQLTARRLAGCCRVDARFTLAFWTLALGRWPLDAGPVGPWSPSALVAWALVVFGSGRCEKPARSTADNPTADATNSPDDHQGFLHKI